MSCTAICRRLIRSCEVGRIGAANVVLEGAELDAAGGGEKSLLGDVEVGIDLPGDLPGDGVLDVEEASEFAGVGERLGEAQLIDLENLRLYGDAAVIDGVAAYDDEVGVEGLRRCGWWWRGRV